MLISIYIILFALCLFKLKVYKHSSNKDYLSKDNCNFIKGFFIILVFISHINQYILGSGYDISSIGDVLYFQLVSVFGQLIVVMFLFFSGFGIMESYRNKGSNYLSSFPKKRILSTFLNFDIAVFSYIILNLVIGKELKTGQILLSLFAWSSIGNSNWYIFCILLCYTMAFLCILIGLYVKRNSSFIIFLLFISSLIAVFLLSFLKEPWWYNTLLCFPLGAFYSYKKKNIDRIVENYYYIFLFLLFFLFLLSRISPLTSILNGTAFNLISIIFAILIVFVMMKIKSENKVLQWAGANLFPLYIYQRLPMILIFELPKGRAFIQHFPICYFLLCLASTVCIAYNYHRWRVSFA